MDSTCWLEGLGGRLDFGLRDKAVDRYPHPGVEHEQLKWSCSLLSLRENGEKEVFRGGGGGKTSFHLGHVGLRDCGHPREPGRVLCIWIKA